MHTTDLVESPLTFDLCHCQSCLVTRHLGRVIMELIFRGFFCFSSALYTFPALTVHCTKCTIKILLLHYTVLKYIQSKISY
uniref:Uncharacterized protein n=1 Tax=Anguilla anguilla TaxID=7936 RepID=A0A0E9XEQ8_ANGAN